MELEDAVLRVGPFLAVTSAILVLFVGKRINALWAPLREMSIPEPVTGGLLCSVLLTVVYLAFGVAIDFDLQARDVLLIYFFTTIGINASFADLLAGGKPLVILLAVSIGFMVLQNLLGVSVAALFGLPASIGVLGGTVSLIGGHGTAIAWAPRIAEQHGVENAMEIGIACATFGMILASVSGGPVARFLIERHRLEPTEDAAPDVSPSQVEEKAGMEALDLLDAVLAIHLSVILGMLLNEGIARLGLQLPLFVTCLFAGIALTNLVPASFPRLTGTRWPTRTPAMAIIADVSLGTFLAMSLMSMQLWTLVDLAGPILAILGCQLGLVLAVSLLLVFPALGRNYDAAVVAAGFCGYSIGSTPTAMANMSAVTARYGASPLAFVVVPLVCAFFIDLANAIIIPTFLGLQ